MMGGSGGTFSRDRTPSRLVEQLRQSEAKTIASSFSVQLSEILGSLLTQFNQRDTEAVQTRLGDIKEMLEGNLEQGSLDQLFGGSVAKHTYLDGLSDIDSLVTIDGTDHEDTPPSVVLSEFAATLRQKLPEDCVIEVGSIAVTLSYPDGMSIQLLPALRDGDTLKIASTRRDGWSSIDPKRFQSALTARNAECAQKLVPTIKLAKAVVANLPEQQQLTGYHIESLAIDVFRNYSGDKTTAAMLPEFFEAAAKRVTSPIRDKTGQSLHVDEYLGRENSTERQQVAHVLERISKRMKNASAAQSESGWLSLLGVEP